jgi:glycosyltransferase involved in cell wall biosynthesis
MHTKKPIVLVLVRYYLPGYKSGGPVRTIANLIDHLSDYIEFRIVTRDRDSLDEAPYPGIKVDAWNRVGKALVYYISPAKQTIRGLLKLLKDTPYDVLYLNSYFDPIFTRRPLLARGLGLLPTKPLVIAPRGEFSAGAFAIRRWKKLPYKWFTSALRLYHGLIWQASSDQEAEDIRRVIGACAQNISVARNLPPLLTGEDRWQNSGPVRDGGPLRVVFLSRITSKKNLDFALRILARVKAFVHFDIYGPIEDESYWRLCQDLMAELPRNVSVRYHGAVAHSAAPTVLLSYDLFFLPTRGENYGHVILESLLAGTPVLIANTTPWRNLEELGIGWDLALDDEQGFVSRIDYASRLSDDAFKLWRKRVYRFACECVANPDVVSNRDLFMKIFVDLETRRAARLGTSAQHEAEARLGEIPHGPS